MSRTQGIRQRLIVILLLGIVTSALSLGGLVQLLTTTTEQRVERARDGVNEEVTRLAQNRGEPIEPSTTVMVGMRAGIGAEAKIRTEVPAAWGATVDEAFARSLRDGTRTVSVMNTDEGWLVVAAEPRAETDVGGRDGASDVQMVWAGMLVRRLPRLRTWQWIIVLLAVGTLFLVGNTAYAIVTVSRGAASLLASLKALSLDLEAKVERPRLRELSDVADGIAHLADDLATARKEESRLGRELARQERLAALGRVAAGVAHEVRNPLASIKLRLDLAAASTALPAVADRAIAHASSEISRLDRLVADLLVVAGRASGPKADLALGSLLRARVEALAPWAQTRDVGITVTGDARARVDADAMARAIDNILRNAVEASPYGATVSATISLQHAHIVIRVVDRGGGVPAARASELFEPFFTTKPEGTGLGLALCRAIARAHGGDVTYVRDTGATTFDLTVAAEANGAGSDRGASVAVATREAAE